MVRCNYEYYSQYEFFSDISSAKASASPQEELQILIRHIDPLQISMLEHDLSKITQPFVFETNLDCRGYDINFENLSFLKSISINVDFSNYAALCKRAGRNVKKILVNFSNLPRCENILIKDVSNQSFMKYAAELTVSGCPLLKGLTIPTDMTVKNNIEGCPKLVFNSKKNNGGFKISKTLLEKELEEVTNDDNINTADLIEVLSYTPSSQNILLVGRHGIGKSEILTDHFENKGMKVIPLFLGQMADPGDLIGLPHFDEEANHTEYYPPYWFPLDKKPIVLFLDELNRARPELMQSVMDLALNRKLAGKKLPEGSQVIAAVNAGDEYQVEELDPALMSRFNVYFFNPTCADWISWAERNDLDDRIINFIEEKPDFLDGKGLSDEKEYENSLFKTPDRRAWKKVSDVVKNIPKLQENHVKFIAGIIGKEAALAFIRYSMNNEKIMVNLCGSQNDDASFIGKGEECNKKKFCI
ncbi:MAG: MoxR family ATPase [Treponema sp.]|nr:MoxR family ATPase [Treponema sp.]